MDKAQWRIHIRQLLKEEHNEALLDQELNKKLILFLQQQKGVWATFSPLREEPAIQSNLLQFPQIQWVYPVVDEQNLRWFQAGALGFQKRSFNVLEPIQEGAKEFKLEQLSGALIPGLAFDKKGVRLGWGKGFYDRALAKAKDGFTKVGVIRSFQFVEKLPFEDHDLQVDMVITEKGLHQIK